MKGVAVQIVTCPHCGWSFVGTGASSDESALRAVRGHLASKHDQHPPDAELRSRIHAGRKTPQP